MITEQPLLFTAAKLARALNRDKRGLLRLLRRTAPEGKIITKGGQLADAWALQSLPDNYRAELDRAAKIKGYSSAIQFVVDGGCRWKPSIPLCQMDGPQISKAERIRKALGRALASYQDSIADWSEVLKIAWKDYQSEFGIVSERTVRRILERVVERDAGEERFDDLALYVGERISKIRDKQNIQPGILTDQEGVVFRYLNAVKTSNAPEVEELDLVWFAACEAICLQIESGIPPKLARREMIDFLNRSAVSLSKNSIALKILLKRKYSRYVSAKGDFSAFCDQRSECSGWKRALELPKADRDLIVAHAALQRGGRVSQSFRELRNGGRLSSEIETHYLANPSNKSYVPQSVRNQVQPEARRLKNIEQGPRTHRLKGAFITRDYSDMAAGDWFQADDVTLPVYFYEETLEAGPMRMRGQFLVMIDVRTDFVLGFLLISERNYDSLSIRSLVTVCAAKHGLPRRGFYFENGIWKKSKIIAGSANTLPFDHADRGLRRLGMDLRNAQLPRGKVIERTIGQLQNRMEGFPGYAGRDERHDPRERAQNQFLDVDAGRRPINNCLLSKEQYCAALAKIIEEHNEEPQQGVRLNGLSPREGWEALQGTIPRQGFDHKWRYILARDVKKIKVGRNGITLRYGKKSFVYHDAETGKRIGEEILAWFDPMLPEILACTDLDHKNVFSVERANPISAMDASPEQLQEELAKINAHQAHGTTLYWTARNTLKGSHYAPTIADSSTLKIGSDIAAQTDRIAALKTLRQKQGRTNRKVIAARGLAPELAAMAESMNEEKFARLGKFLSDPETQEAI